MCAHACAVRRMYIHTRTCDPSGAQYAAWQLLMCWTDVNGLMCDDLPPWPSPLAAAMPNPPSAVTQQMAAVEIQGGSNENVTAHSCYVVPVSVHPTEAAGSGHCDNEPNKSASM